MTNSRWTRGAARALAGLACTLGLACAAIAQEPPSRSAILIQYRQGTMLVIGGTFPQLGGMAAGKIPYDAKRAQVLADRMAMLGPLATEVFPSDSKEGAKTQAKPEIWADKAEFDKILNDFVEKTAALSAAAKVGTLDALKPAVGDVGKVCKACHDKYKEK